MASEREKLSDEEILKLLDEEIEDKEELPSRHDLDKPEWSVSKRKVRQAAGNIGNALWMLGRKRETKQIVVDNARIDYDSADSKTELLQHELRGLEHELGRSPSFSECMEFNHRHYDNIRERSGIPYRPLCYRGRGVIPAEREDELVEMLFVEKKDPVVLEGNHFSHEEYDSKDRAAPYEMELVAEEYIPWVDETGQ